MSLLAGSPGSSNGDLEARYKAKAGLARLRLEKEERVSRLKLELEYRHKLEVRRLELESEAEVKVKIRRLELAAASASGQAGSTSSVQSTLRSSTFDVRHVSLVPPFRETEVSSYFHAFKRIATTLNWLKDVWTFLLQCKLVGKAQEVVAALPLDVSLNYDSVKAAVLRAYELVPEAYRQKFRSHRKSPSRTYVEFAREMGTLFDRWCSASKAEDFDSIRELMLLEEFKNSLPERMVVHLNEQKVTSLAEAAVLADTFVLTHKTVFTAPPRVETRSEVKSELVSPYRFQSQSSVVTRSSKERSCFYCHKPGHVIADCLALKRKPPQGPAPKGVGLIKTVKPAVKECVSPDPTYQPFIFQGVVSFPHDPTTKAVIQILRDTGAAQSLVLQSVLPWSEQSYCGSNVLLQMGCVPVPLHEVRLASDLVSGSFRVGVQAQLPVPGVSMILGNDIAGGKVHPVLEVLDTPDACVSEEMLEVFPVCAVTRAQARRGGDVAGLAGTVLAPVFTGEAAKVSSPPSPEVKPLPAMFDTDVNLPVTREKFIVAQTEDVSLAKCFENVSPDRATAQAEKVAYFIENGLLMRTYNPRAGVDSAWSTVVQVVVPRVLRNKVLSLAHDIPWSGHLGVTKTYDRVLRHFFWPGMKSDVAQYCRTCHTCQVTGKPNQVIPPAPLRPIPAMGEPFERVIVDCVGPLPRTRSGNQYLLTMICVATRYPEAIPLRNITAKAVVKALTKHFSTFGLPKVVQTDQDSNFLSRLFAQVLKSLSISHKISSAYHPESQGALERWHQTLKAMLRKYCHETAKDWDDGVPMVLFAIRETVQESLGFSPAELVFGHTVRGPLKVIKDQLMSADSRSQSVLQYVSQFRERLHEACSLAKETLSSTQKKMKRQFDEKAVSRSFQAGDQVLVLLPIPGAALSARFSGPYVIDRKLSETDYIVHTPDRRRASRVCHINMLKRYHGRDVPSTPSTEKVVGPAVSSVASVMKLPVSDGCCGGDEDGLVLRNAPQQCARLGNSEMLIALPSHLTHLDQNQSANIVSLKDEFPSLFGDVPNSRTTVLEHDVDVGNASPIKQHAYRVNMPKRLLMKKEVDYLLEHHLAVPSSSPWSSPCILVPKPDGTVRFCTDYRKVNAVTVPDSFPLPRINDCVDTIGSARFVSKLDLLKGYWQVPLTPRASDLSIRYSRQFRTILSHGFWYAECACHIPASGEPGCGGCAKLCCLPG